MIRITIGNGVTTIASYAFRGCSQLTSVTISGGVTSIGFLVFENCTALTSVTFAVTEGWRFGSYNRAEGTDILPSELADSAIACEYLTSTYAGYLWYRSATEQTDPISH